MTQLAALLAPGVGFGELGEGYVRIALSENNQRIRQATRNIRRFLARADEFAAKYAETQ